MHPELGNGMKTVTPQEKITKQAPLWQDILINGALMAILGFLFGSLMGGAGLEPPLPFVLGAVVTGIFTFFCVFVNRSSKKNYAKTYLTIHERGVSGESMANAFSTKSFALPYAQLRSAVAKNLRLTLNTDGGSFFLFVDNAQALADELMQRKG